LARPLSPLYGRTVARNEADQINKENTVSDQLYLLIQGWLIIVLTVLDGGEALIQHPGWFQ
jgi:hypothetical protein